MTQIYGTSRGVLYRLDRADLAIESGMNEFDGKLWVAGEDLADFAQDAVIDTWLARVGTSPTQSDNAKRPKFDRETRCAVFDGGDDALLCVPDLSSTDNIGIICTAYSNLPAAARIVYEYTTNYNTNHGLSVTANNQRYSFGVHLGAPNTDYVFRLDADTAGDRLSVMGGRHDGSAPAANDLIELWKVDAGFGGEVTNFASTADFNSSNNFAAANSWLGGRDNGTAFPHDGGIREFMLFGKIPSHAAFQELMRHAAVKASLL